MLLRRTIRQNAVLAANGDKILAVPNAAWKLLKQIELDGVTHDIWRDWAEVLAYVARVLPRERRLSKGVEAVRQIARQNEQATKGGASA